MEGGGAMEHCMLSYVVVRAGLRDWRRRVEI